MCLMAWKNNAEIFQIFYQWNNQEFLWNDTKSIHSLYQVNIHKRPKMTFVNLRSIDNMLSPESLCDILNKLLKS